MTESILNSVKKVLGIAEDYTEFDVDIIMHINSVFSDIFQLGLGSDEGFSITGADEEWDDFLNGDRTLNSVKTYVWLRVRLLFDPPTTSYAIESMNKQRQEMEWRLNVRREEVKYPWVDEEPTNS